jgi:hypothetical protein
MKQKTIRVISESGKKVTKIHAQRQQNASINPLASQVKAGDGHGSTRQWGDNSHRPVVRPASTA